MNLRIELIMANLHYPQGIGASRRRRKGVQEGKSRKMGRHVLRLCRNWQIPLCERPHKRIWTANARQTRCRRKVRQRGPLEKKMQEGKK